MDGFESLLASESCLSQFRGRIAEKNSCNSPSYTKVDFRFTQEIRLPNGPWLGDSNLQFIFDIENLGNLINSDWGRYEQYSFPFRKATVTLDGDSGTELIFETLSAKLIMPLGLSSPTTTPVYCPSGTTVY